MRVFFNLTKIKNAILNYKNTHVLLLYRNSAIIEYAFHLQNPNSQ